MLRLIPGWKQLCEQTLRHRVKKTRLPRDRRARRPAFEELECRRVLAGGVIPAGVESFLQAKLQPIVANSLQGTQNLPFVGSALDDSAFVDNQVAQLMDQIDTDSVTPGAIKITPGTTTTFSINTPLHSTGFKGFQISGNGLSPFKLSTDPKVSPSTFIYAYVDIYYRLSFTVDALTGTTTFLDAPLSGLIPTVSNANPNIGYLGIPWDSSSPAPNSPISIVITAATPFIFQAGGTLSGIATTIKPHAYSVTFGGNLPVQSDFTYVYSTIDVSMGNFSFGPSGTVAPNVSALLNGDAHINLDLSLAMTDPLKIYASTEMMADWTFSNVNILSPPSPTAFGDLPFVDFTHVTVDLGRTLGAIGDALNEVQGVTDSPLMADFINILNTQIPIIGESIADVAEAKGLVSSGFADAISALAFINSLHVTGQGNDGVVDLGSFRILDPRQPGPIQISQTSPSNAQPKVHSFLHDVFGLDLPNTDAQYGLHFNFLEDPVDYLFPAIAGQNVKLVTFATPPLNFTFTMDDIFSLFGAFDIFSGYPGVSADGSLNIHAEVNVGYDMTGVLRGMESSAPDSTDQNYGFYIDTAHTGVSVTGKITLSTNVVAFSVDGGIAASFVGVPNGNLDPFNPNYLRGGLLLTEPSKLFLGYGSISASATLTPLDPAGPDITLGSGTIATFDVGPWSTTVQPVSSQEVIEIDKGGSEENIFVLQTHLDPSTHRPVFGTPDEYDLAIQVVREKSIDYYLLAKYEKLPNGTYQKTQSYSSVDLIYVAGNSTIPITDPKDTAGVKVFIDDLDGSGGSIAPVNAIILGSNKDDTLKYFGAGKAIIVGFEGNDTIRSAPTLGAGAGSQLVSEFVDAAQPLTNDFHLSDEIWNKINATRTDPVPPKTANSITGSGGTDLIIQIASDSTSASANSTVFTSAQPTAPPPAGGAELESGPAGTNSDLDTDESYIEIVAGNVAGPAGAIIGGHNHIVLDAAIGTPTSTGNLDLSVVNTSYGPALHILGSQIDFTAQGISEIEIGSYGGTLHIGDLSSLGVIPIVVDSLIGSAGTATTIDSVPVNSASNIQIGHDANQQGQMTITGSGLLPNIEFLGLSHLDSVLLNLYGGTVVVADLAGAGLATLRIDDSGRTIGSSPSAAVTLENDAADMWFTPDTSNPSDIRTTSDAEPTVILGGVRAIDNLTVNLGGSEQQAAFFDASQLKGQLNINGGGGTSAVDGVTLAGVNAQAVVTVDGGTAQTTLTFGHHLLSNIKHDVTARNVQLHIDNSGATDARIMTLNPTTFTGWDAGGGLTPTLFISQLHSTLTVDAGGGDAYLLDGTPVAITDIVLNNKTDTRSRIYSDNWQSPISANHDWAIYLGQRISPNGTVTRTKHLGGLSNVQLTLDFGSSSDATTDVVIDGDLDAAGAQYSIDGGPHGGLLDITNQTIGLAVKIAHFRAQDDLYVYMPGATVNADVTRTSAGTIYLDGQARLAGTNPTAPNTISIADRYGQTQLTPLTQYNSLLHSFNDIYLLGSMPQDALTVSVPTNVLITAGVPTQLDLDQNPDAYATVNSTLYGSTLIGWKSGARPSDNGGFFVFENVDDDQWSSVFAPGAGNGTPPNPFEELPYGIVMPSVDTDLTVTYHIWENINGVMTLVDVPIDGTGRFWTVNPNPAAVDNSVQLNASQVRGTFNFNVTGPDYDYVEQLERAMVSATELSVSYNAPFYVWGNHYDDMRIAFGQSNITLTDVNPQLSVNINSQNKVYSYPAGSFTSFPDHDDKVIRSAYPATTLNVGGGTLARIQGNVSVQNMIVNVDDSAGTTANNLILNSTTLGTWTTTGGTTQPVLTIGPLDSRTFTVIAGTVDKIDVEGVPTTAGLTSIQTANNSTTPVDVYLMGRAQASPFQAVGNLNLHIGDRLNANGSVTLAGQVSGTWATNSTSVPINYQYTGINGHGLLVYDAANTSASSAPMAIGPVTGDATKQQLVFNNTRTIVLYGANTDVSYYEPVFGISNIFNLIDNRLNGAVHYYANASGPFSRVNVQAAFGPVEVDGRGVNTDVEISPASFGVLGLGTSPVGNDLSTTILAPVTVTHATLAIRSDTSSTPAPSQPKNVVIGTSQITGIAGAAIQYSNLVDTVTFDTIPGLLVQMPRFAANLTVAGTLAGVTTGVSVVGQSMLSTQVTGTSGRLALGTFDENGTYFFVDGGQEFNYTTQSLTIGNGSVQNIHGDVLVGGTGHFSTLSGMVIDDRNDTAGRTATFNTTSLTNSNAPTLAGLAAGNIAMRQIPGGLTVYTSAGSHWTLQGIDSLGPATMYAGVGTIVDLAGPPGNFSNSAVIPRWTVYGAGTVRLNPGAVPKVNSLQFPIIKADPARPTDITQLIVDHTNVQAVFFDDNSVPSGVNNFIQVLDKSSDGLGRVSLGNSTDLQTEVEFAPTTTQLTVTGDHSNTPQINILDTVALSTTINPDYNQVNVLGTTAPLVITQPALRFSGDAASIILGNNNSMQALHGDITLDGSNATLPTMPATLSFSADNTNHVVTFANPSAGHVDITGLAPAAIHVVGSLIAPSITAGSGNNTLVGANATNSWIINAANAGTLNSIFKFAGFRNLIGGSGADTFRFTTGGSLAGNLDGGPGVDTLTYDNSSTWHTLPYNLSQGIAPLVGGTASNLEIVPIDHGSGSNQLNFINDVISYSPLSILGGLGAFTFSATGLPAGLSIDVHTGAITGTIATQLSGDHAVHVSATDGFNSAATDFTWTIQTFSLINPGTIRSHAGDVISQPIQVQGSATGLTFSAISLPDGLSIDPATGLISGTLTTQAAQVESYGTIVSATDGGSVQSVSFLWLVPSFALQNPGDQTVPEGAPLHIPLLAYNLSGDFLGFSVSGLSDDFHVYSDGTLVGMFGLTGEPESFDVTVTASHNYVTDTVEFTITTELGFDISGNDYRQSSDGVPIDTQIAVSSPYGHQLSVAVSGLPQGLTIDDNLHITGTISRSAVSTTPHHVTVAVTNETLGYTYDAGFDWLVTHVPTAGELNNGSPAGVPFLTTVLDPESFPYLTGFAGVTYGSGPSAHSIEYFLDNEQLWQFDGQNAKPVASVDPENPTVPQTVIQDAAIPGRGIIFADQQTGQLWFADAAGARMIYSGSLELFTESNSFTVGAFGFVDAEQFDPATSTFTNVVLQLSFDANSNPTVSTIFNTPYQFDSGNMISLGGGLIFTAAAPANQAETLYWYDPTSSQLHTLLSSSSIGSFAHFTVGANSDGTQTLYFIENAFGFAILDTLNSSQLSAPHPSITMNESFNEVDNATAYAAGRLVVMESKPGGDGQVIQLYLSNGSGGNTQPIGQPFSLGSDGSLSDPMVVGNDVYFIYTPPFQYNQITDSTVTAQIWKLNVPTASLSSVTNFFGSGPVLAGIYNLTVGGGKIFFTMYDSSRNLGLWEFDPTTGPAEVAGNPQNQFVNPDRLAYFNGALYFDAYSPEVTDSGGNPTIQTWELGPAAPVTALPGDFNGDGSVDAADYVVWRASGGSQADYNTWRSNFGRTLASGSGEANLSVVEATSTPTSQSAVPATSTGSATTPSSDDLASAPTAPEVISAAAHTAPTTAIVVSSGSAAEMSDDSVDSPAAAPQENSSVADTSQPSVARYSPDDFFSLYHPAELLRGNRSARFSVSPRLNADTILRQSPLSDDLEQLPAETYSLVANIVESKTAADGGSEVDRIEPRYRDEVFDALSSRLLVPVTGEGT